MKQAITVRLSKNSIEQIKKLAEMTSASQAEVVAIAVDRYYNQQKSEK